MKFFPLSIVIVTWNSKKYIYSCVESIFKFYSDDEVEVIIIDNNSSDDTQLQLRRLRQKYSFVKIILNEKNIGFAKANNLGILNCSHEFILFLNPDTKLLEKNLHHMQEVLYNNKKVALVGGIHYNQDMSIQPSVRRFPTLIPQIGILLKFHHIFRRLRTFKYYFADDFDYNKPQKVEQIAGSFIMSDANRLKQLNFWDQKIHLWFEDVDLCKNAYKFNYAVYFTPFSSVLHFGHESFNMINMFKKQIMFNNSRI